MSTPWRPPSALRWLLGWTSLTTLVFWLAAVRGAFDGLSYEWGLGGFSGQGIHGDYWFPVAGSLVALVILACGWRGGAFPASFAIASWHTLLFAGAMWLAVSIPDLFRFRGDTVGIDISLTWLAPALSGLGAALAVAWARRSRRQGAVRLPSWGPHNQRRLLLLIAFLPVQLCLFRFGAPDGLSDQAGVLLTGVQWFMAGALFRPIPAREPPGRD